MTQPGHSCLRKLRALGRGDFREIPPGPAAPPPETLEISLLIPAHEIAPSLEGTLREAHDFLAGRFGDGFEIILIPNPSPDAGPDASIRACEALAGGFPRVRVVPHLAPPLRPGKGAALRTGFFASAGKAVFFTDADLPYDLTFIDAALGKMAQGFDLVTANRRFPGDPSGFPPALLRGARDRRRLGSIFNRAVRLLFPIRTADTQAGAKGMSRRLASLAFSRGRCPGFFFDLEIFLSCLGKGWAHAEVPVAQRRDSGNSTVCVPRESLLAVYWLFRIWAGFVLGRYGKPPPPDPVLARYRDLGWGTRLFLSLRWWLTPYAEMAAFLPRSGLIYDLGCGHGLFGLELARRSSERRVVGFDLDPERIRAARRACAAIENLRFENAEVSGVEARAERFGRPVAISLIDVLHYLDPRAQESQLAQAWRLLPDDGVLIFRETALERGWLSKWNRLYEKIAAGAGLTPSLGDGLFFRTQDQWLKALSAAGFRARARRCSAFLFADVLYVGEKVRRSEGFREGGGIGAADSGGPAPS